jgi:hypothetical protein
MSEQSKELPSFKVKNWTEAQELTVYAVDHTDTLITLSSYAGACSFCFNVTPAQARELADALHACANALEVEVMEVAP